MNRNIASLMLVGGALVGVMLAAYGLLEGKTALPDSAVARVNDITIDREQFDSYLAIINANSRTEKDRHEILVRLIDEELLVQRGVELGFLQLNSTVRNAIVQAVTRRFVADDPAPVPDTELEGFFNSNLSYFTPAEQFRIVLLAPTIPIPDAPLTLRSIADYLGAAVADHIETANTGETIEVLSDGQRFKIRLVERTGGEAPLFKNVRPMVEREYRRAQSEKAFNEYLVWLRDRADIVFPEPGP